VVATITCKIQSWERARLRMHLLRPDPENRRQRFCQPANDGFFRRCCDRIGWRLTSVVGCFVDDALDGVAELGWPSWCGSREAFAFQDLGDQGHLAGEVYGGFPWFADCSQPL
jgi:hypothetical protein